MQLKTDWQYTFPSRIYRVTGGYILMETHSIKSMRKVRYIKLPIDDYHQHNWSLY